MLRRSFMGLVACLAVAIPAWGQDAGKQSAAILEKVAPYIQQTTVGVVHLNLEQVDVEATMKSLRGFLTEPLVPQQEFVTGTKKMVELKAKLREVGIKEVVVVADIASQPDFRPVVVVFLEEGKTGEPMVEQFQKEFHLDRAEKLPGKVVLGSAATIDRLKAGQPVVRPDLMAAMAATNPGAVRVAIGIPTEVKRVFSQMIPPLPPEVPVDAKKMTNDFSWFNFSLQLNGELAAQAHLESASAETAAEFGKLFQLGKQYLEQDKNVPGEVKTLVGVFTPQVKGSGVSLSMDAKTLAATQQVQQMLQGILGKSRQAASASMSMNNMKQFMLAMHNYHDTIGHFPMAASVKKDGKRLMSWRVYLLPYLEQAPLYNEFHLDEPWDSDHNKKLIAKMPKIFAAPTLPAELAEKGMTTYVVPVGKGTLFGRDKSVKLQEVTDGTSNTGAILEANAKNAVIWTKPDDIDVDADGLLSKLEVSDGTFMLAFADGSVRRIKLNIDPKVLKHILQMADGNVVEIP